ncbi:MAG: PmoA family protein, partial [Bacteroidales bacterium]|nr:PmoA family protein [Bacteroidales bacterium]
MTRFIILLSVALLVHACSGGSNEIEMVQTTDELTITDEGREVLTYRISEQMPPEGVDPLFRRSGFIHPLRSPGGEVLTQIQPPDHYHHYGIWGPWTKTRIGDREIDYWNLAKGEGTVRTKAILTSSSGPDHAAFTALQSHIDFGHQEGERITMDEFYEVRYLGMEKEEPRYMVDITSTFRNVIEDTIIFEAYRYGGGLGYRATERWNAENSSVLTSEGEERVTADVTRARWCLVEGESSAEEGRSGILFMSHPANREHPEPMRVWPTDMPNGGL